MAVEVGDLETRMAALMTASQDPRLVELMRAARRLGLIGSYSEVVPARYQVPANYVVDIDYLGYVAWIRARKGWRAEFRPMVRVFNERDSNGRSTATVVFHPTCGDPLGTLGKLIQKSAEKMAEIADAAPTTAAALKG